MRLPKLPKAGHTAEEIRAWLQMIFRLTGWSPSRLAQEAGVAPSTLNRFLSEGGKHLPSSTTLGRIEEAACVRIRERIVDGQLAESDLAAAVAGPNGTVFVDEIMDGEIVGKWGFPEQWFHFTYGTSPEQCVIFRVKDDAMAPELHRGDQAIVDKRIADPTKGGAGIYVLHSPAGWVARAVEPLPNGLLRVSAMHKAFESYTTRPDRLQVVGRIAGMWRRLSAVMPGLLPFIG